MTVVTPYRDHNVAITAAAGGAWIKTLSRQN